jgi:osmoprotectant transport system permease protein
MNTGEPLIRWEWVVGHVADIAHRLGEHIILTLTAVVIGFLLSFALAMLVRRFEWTYAPVTWVTGVLYTVPSLALFALLIPFTGLSLLTAEIGLVSYTLLILVRSVVGGLQAVPAEAREAAIAMGYTSRGLLWHIELPLALVIIIGGIRVSTVTTIGLVTVTALIGQGGLGFLILQGIQQLGFTTPLIIGALLSVVLAVAADTALVMAQRWMTPWAR